MCIARMDGSLIKVNPAFVRALGHEEETLLTSNFLDFVHPDDVARTVSEMQRILGGSGTREFENRYRCRNGNYVVLSWSCAPPRDNGDVFAVARNITETRRIAQNLAHSERLYRSIVEGASDLINVLDGEGRFQFTNHMARTVYGLEPEDCVGLSYAEFVHPDDLEATVRDVGGWITDGKTHALYENRQVRRDGSVRTLSWNIAIHYNDAGDVQTIIAIGRDVTDKKRTEDALRRALLAAEEANRSKTMFLASTSHELRTPLNAILGFSDMLRQSEFGNIGPEKVRGYASDIHKSGETLLNLVNDILDITSLEQNKIKINRNAFDVCDLLEEVLKEASFLSASKEIAVLRRCPSSAVVIHADRTHLKRVAANLVGNALKYSNCGDQIEVAVHRLDGFVRLAVSDNGPGIPPDYIDKVTEPFVRGNQDPAVAGTGWGLGLAIAKSLVELHDGKLSIRSELGTGTTVEVDVPALP